MNIVLIASIDFIAWAQTPRRHDASDVIKNMASSYDQVVDIYKLVYTYWYIPVDI
jgi:hypothetical protein